MSKHRHLRNGKRQAKQLVLPLYEEYLRSEAPKEPRPGVEPPLATPMGENAAKLDRIMEEICQPQNLKEALTRVKSNKGCPGIDGMTVGQLVPYLLGNGEEIRSQLLEGIYQPQPVMRVWIPKYGGTKRKLGIPTVLDRFIQQAISQVVAKLSEYIRGWRTYYGIIATQWTLRDYDSWIRRRLRCLIWKQWKGNSRYRELRKRGCSVAMAWDAANGSIGSRGARVKRAMTKAFPNKFFEDKRLVSLTMYK